MASDTFKLRFVTQAGDSLDLAAALMSHNAGWPIRVASHVYLGRDGAEQEPTGAGPGAATYRLCFVGADFAARYRALVAAIRKSPRGVLTDPLVGSLPACCTGISDASRDLSREKNAVNITIAFQEDSLDTAIRADQAVQAASAPSEIRRRATAATTAAAPFTSAGSAVALVVNKANLFASLVSAVASGSTGTVIGGIAVQSGAASLSSTLASVAALTDLAVRALLGDPAATSARAYTAVSRLVDLYAACIVADRALAAGRPAIVSYVVGGPISVYVLCARLYGSARAGQMAALILGTNRIPDPLLVPAGTRLRLPQPEQAGA